MGRDPGGVEPGRGEAAQGRRAAVPALLPGRSWALGERVERGSGAGGGKLSQCGGLRRAARRPRSLRSVVCSPGGGVVGAWTRGERARSGTSETRGGLG